MNDHKNMKAALDLATKEDKQLKEKFKKYLKDNLTLDIDEESYGFNGKHLVFRIKIEDETICEDTVDINRDEG